MFGNKKTAFLLVVAGAVLGTGCYGTYYGSSQGSTHTHTETRSSGVNYCSGRLPTAQQKIETMYTRIDGRRSAYMQETISTREGVRYTVEVATTGTGDIARHTVKTGLSDIVVDCGRDGTGHNCFVDIYLDGIEVASMGPNTRGQVPIQCVAAGERDLVIEHAGTVVYDHTLVLDSDVEYEIDIIEASPGDFRVNVHSGDNIANRMPPIPGGDRRRADRGDHGHDHRDDYDRSDRRHRDHDRGDDRRDRADDRRDTRDDRRDTRDDRRDTRDDRRDTRDDRRDRADDRQDARDDRRDRADDRRDARDDRRDRADTRRDRTDEWRDRQDDRRDDRDDRTRGRVDNDKVDVERPRDRDQDRVADLNKNRDRDRAERGESRDDDRNRGVDAGSVDVRKRADRDDNRSKSVNAGSVDVRKRADRDDNRSKSVNAGSVDVRKRADRADNRSKSVNAGSVDVRKRAERDDNRSKSVNVGSVDVRKRTERDDNRSKSVNAGSVDVRKPVKPSGGTIRGTEAGSVKTKGRVAGSNNSPMSSSKFQDLLERVRRESRQELRHALIRDAARRYYFTSKQASKLVAELVTTRYKTNAAEVLYGRVVDKQNYGIVLDEFDDQDDRRSVERTIGWNG